MLVIQTGDAKRLRQYSKLMVLILLLTGSFGALLTMHWPVLPPTRKPKWRVGERANQR
jgi:hypothetical protein